MSKPKTQYCDWCAHGSTVDDNCPRLVCAKGHAPRFFKPRDHSDAIWGWKRRCTDYVEAEQ